MFSCCVFPLRVPAPPLAPSVQNENVYILVDAKCLYVAVPLQRNGKGCRGEAWPSICVGAHTVEAHSCFFPKSPIAHPSCRYPVGCCQTCISPFATKCGALCPFIILTRHRGVLVSCMYYSISSVCLLNTLWLSSFLAHVYLH